MKKELLLFFSLLFSVCLFGQSQNSKWQMEAGFGLKADGITSSREAMGLSMYSALKYQHRAVDFEFRFDASSLSFGTNRPKRYNNNSRIARTAHTESIYNSMYSFLLFANYNYNLENFKPIFGLGYAYTITNPRATYYNNQLYNVLPEKENRIQGTRFHSFVINVGYKINDFRYNVMFYLPAKFRGNGDNNQIFALSLGYNLGLTKSESPPLSYSAFKPHRKLPPIMIRFEYGLSTFMPTEKYSSASRHFFYGVQLHLVKKGYLSYTQDKIGNKMGYDDETIIQSNAVRFNDENATSVGGSISSHKIAYHFVKPYSRNIDWHFGGGLGIYEYKPDKSLKESIVLQERGMDKDISNYGFFLCSGFRTGLFSNRLEVNFPVGALPVYIGFRSSIGIHLRNKNPLFFKGGGE